MVRWFSVKPGTSTKHVITSARPHNGSESGKLQKNLTSTSFCAACKNRMYENCFDGPNQLLFTNKTFIIFIELRHLLQMSIFFCDIPEIELYVLTSLLNVLSVLLIK